MALTTPPPSRVVAPSAPTGVVAEPETTNEAPVIQMTAASGEPRLDHVPEEIVNILQQPSAKDSGIKKLGDFFLSFFIQWPEVRQAMVMQVIPTQIPNIIINTTVLPRRYIGIWTGFIYW